MRCSIKKRSVSAYEATSALPPETVVRCGSTTAGTERARTPHAAMANEANTSRLRAFAAMARPLRVTKAMTRTADATTAMIGADEFVPAAPNQSICQPSQDVREKPATGANIRT